MKENELIDQLRNADPLDGLALISNTVPQKGLLSSSLGKEDQILTHMIAKSQFSIGIFTIDTGRLFQETYDLLALTKSKYHINIRTFFPEHHSIEKMVTAKGPNSFYDSVENRKECCHIRKVEPLGRALAGAKVWITGLRAEHSSNRQSMEVASWDDKYKLVKYNPLLRWTAEEVDTMIEENKIPVNTLHRQGFASIGCAPCTRPVGPGEDQRAGRWWWEASAKECGLHETKA